jgi:Holliday junction resolvase RusA-like endonuclease
VKVLALFRVPGRARTKGSLKAYCRKDRAHTIRLQEEVEDSKKWRHHFAVHTQRHMRKTWGRLLKHDGPVEVRLLVWLAPDFSKAQGAAPDTVVPSHDTPFPTYIDQGDTDKFARNVDDALKDAGMITDDSRVVTLLVAKRWLPQGQRLPYVEVVVLEASNPGRPEWMPEIPDV